MSNIIDFQTLEEDDPALLAFRKANRFIIDKYGPRVRTEHRRYWEQEFNVKIGLGPGWGQWINLEFATPEELTWFLLRWA